MRSTLGPRFRGDERKVRSQVLPSKTRQLRLTTILRQPVAMQIAAVDVEPDFGALMIGTKALDQPPKPGGMIHLDEMRHFMSGEIVEHKARREDKPPRVG